MVNFQYHPAAICAFGHIFQSGCVKGWLVPISSMGTSTIQWWSEPSLARVSSFSALLVVLYSAKAVIPASLLLLLPIGACLACHRPDGVSLPWLGLP